jgi:hypothetical protein
MTQLGALGL